MKALGSRPLWLQGWNLSPRRPVKRSDRTTPTSNSFDVLALDGEDVMDRPYLERRELLESLDLHGSH